MRKRKRMYADSKTEEECCIGQGLDRKNVLGRLQGAGVGREGGEGRKAGGKDRSGRRYERKKREREHVIKVIHK